MALPFRRRIFGILVALTAVPITLAVVGWVLAARTTAPSAGARVALEGAAASARQMLERMDTTHLTARERAAFRHHLNQLSNSVTLVRRAETYLRYYAAGLAALVLAHGPMAAAAEVMAAETDRLARLAREFADFGRLTEGTKSEVDLVELLDDLGRTAVPPGVEVSVRADGGPRTISGHYDPLRRAFGN